MAKRRLVGFALVLAAGCLGCYVLLCGGMAKAEPAEASGVEAKLHALVDQLTPEQQAALYLLLSQLTAQSGQTAAAAADQNPLAIAKEKLAAFIDAAKKGEIDRMMENISEDFEHYQLGDKEGLRSFLENASNMGYLEDLEINLDDTEIEQDGDTVILYPVEVEGAFGSAVFEFEAKQENGAWMIVGLDASGI